MSDLLINQARDGVAERLAAGRLTIPVLPVVAMNVLNLMNDENADLGSLAALLRNDPALAGHVMKFANSPLVRVGEPMVSLQQAIARLGMRTLADVILAACLGPKLFKAPAFAGLIDRIWLESLATGLWAREIARSLRRNVEVSFLCGLLHQIGRPVVLQAIQDVLGERAAQLDPAALDDLLAVHGVHAGQLVARSWRLPELVTVTIGGVTDLATVSRERELVATVIVARAFAACTLGDTQADAEQLAALPAIEDINLYLSDIERLLELGEAMHAAVAELML